MRDDDIDISLQDAPPKPIPTGASPDEDPGVCVQIVGLPDPTGPKVFILESVMRELEGHAAVFPEREVGGVLLGRLQQQQGAAFLVVEHSIRGLSAEGSATRLTFTHDTWVQINASRDREFPHLHIVGWYHTHPGLGIFMSRDDQYIHRNFFCEPWQIALVVDPINHTRGLFVLQNARVTQVDGMRIYAPAGERHQLEQYVSALTRGRPAHTAQDSAHPGAVVYRPVFADASVSCASFIPPGLQRFFGITAVETAPRISIKSLIIALLCALVVLQGMHARDAERTTAAYHRLEQRLKNTDARVQELLKLQKENGTAQDQLSDPNDSSSGTTGDARSTTPTATQNAQGEERRETPTPRAQRKPGPWERFIRTLQ